jgi:hypothetical protein
MRLQHLDGFRGFFLLSMALGHIAFFIRSDVGTLTHHTNGFVDAAQGFVTISGIVIGLVFGKQLLRVSDASMRRKMIARMIVVWRWHLFILGTIIAFAVALRGAEAPLISQLATDPWLVALLGATLLSGPMFVDILPMYLVFMALTPAALVAMQRGLWRRVAAVSAIAWAIGQTDLPNLAWITIAEQIGLAENGVAIGLYFNRLGWQVLYFAGLAGGFLMAQGKLSLTFLHRPIGGNLALISAFLAGLFFALPRVLAFGELGPEANTAIMAAFDRQDMTLLRILTFAAHFYLALWFLIAAPNARGLWLRRLSRMLDAIVTWQPLIFLGRHSLQVYTWHVLLCYLLAIFAADWLNAAPWLWREGAVIVAVLTLFVPAALNVKYRRCACRLRLAVQT